MNLNKWESLFMLTCKLYLVELYINLIANIWVPRSKAAESLGGLREMK